MSNGSSNLEYYRLWINKEDQLNLFGKAKSNKQILAHVFHKEFKFTYKDSEYIYKPVTHNSDYILAKFARKGKDSIIPDEKLEETKLTDWKVCYLLISIHDDPIAGQKIIIQCKKGVSFNGFETLNILAEELNKQILEFATGYRININPISEKKRFWDIVKNNKITSVIMDLKAPNLFGGKSKLEQELKEAEQAINAKREIIEYENINGLKLSESNEKINESVDYLCQGGGILKLKAGDTIVFNSTTAEGVKRKQIELPVELFNSNKKEEILEVVIGFLDK